MFEERRIQFARTRHLASQPPGLQPARAECTDINQWAVRTGAAVPSMTFGHSGPIIKTLYPLTFTPSRIRPFSPLIKLITQNGQPYLGCNQQI